MKDGIVKDQNEKTPWAPTYVWYAKVAGIILVVLIAAFFILNILLKPYMRERPIEITPWLEKDKPAAEQKYKHETSGMAIVEGTGNEK